MTSINGVYVFVHQHKPMEISIYIIQAILDCERNCKCVCVMYEKKALQIVFRRRRQIDDEKKHIVKAGKPNQCIATTITIPAYRIMTISQFIAGRPLNLNI